MSSEYIFYENKKIIVLHGNVSVETALLTQRKEEVAHL